ncbi:hypothetical protein L6452_32140 [Arctium lappa]|uniref:Uncharacterized protein n=1 Tax=Arctium lappa TaxID=4217 RepID=A0ACB8Z4C3_ARCLA|nr:hypothetical protein L6452_32140 [Arctium lappa]
MESKSYEAVREKTIFEKKLVDEDFVGAKKFTLEVVKGNLHSSDIKGRAGEKEKRKATTIQSLLKYAHNRVGRNEVAMHDRVQKARTEELESKSYEAIREKTIFEKKLVGEDFVGAKKFTLEVVKCNLHSS